MAVQMAAEMVVETVVEMERELVALWEVEKAV